MLVASLSQLKQGNSATVSDITADERTAERLQNIGLIKGTVVKCMQKTPSDDPIAYLIRGAVIALRLKDSSCVEVVINDT